MQRKAKRNPKLITRASSTRNNSHQELKTKTPSIMLACQIDKTTSDYHPFYKNIFRPYPYAPLALGAAVGPLGVTYEEPLP